MNITTTETGTCIVKGIEYNDYPPPTKLCKTMERKWAEKLKSKGSLRFGNIAKYRCCENKILGDKHEGKGMLTMHGHEYNIGSVNDVFAWCSSLECVSDKRVLEIAQHGGYDCVVEINSPDVFLERIARALRNLTPNRKLHLHCGTVVYNRGQQVGKKALNSQQFHFNIFQKDKKFSEDCEYRLSLTDLCSNTRDCHITIEAGDCSDIITIRDLSIT